MLLGEMKLTHYFYTTAGDLYAPHTTMKEAAEAYKVKFGIDWRDDKRFLDFKTVMPSYDFNWCMAL